MYLIINSEIAQFLVELFKVLGSLQLEHLALHVVVLCDLVQIFLVFFAVVDGHCDTFADKATSASDPVDVRLRVAAPSAIG